MRLTKSALNDLLGASSGAGPASPLPTPNAPPHAVAPTSTPVPVAEPATPPLVQVPLETGTKPPKEAPSDVRFELGRALPALWSKAQKEAAGDKTVREKDKLRDLIVWLLTKRSATVRQRMTLHFKHEGQAVSGRLDVVAHLTDRSELAIEVDWAYSRPSIEKLQAAHRQGMRVMWVCGAPLTKAAAKALRSRATAEFGPTYGWLFMYHLEHGWI